MLHIAVSADCAGPKGFSFELITTVSAESGCIPRVPLRRAVCPAAAGGVIEANAGNVVDAAEAAPTMRRNDLRETPCVVSELMESSPRKGRIGEKRHHGDRRMRPTEDPEDQLHISCKANRLAATILWDKDGTAVRLASIYREFSANTRQIIPRTVEKTAATQLFSTWKRRAWPASSNQCWPHHTLRVAKPTRPYASTAQPIHPQP